MKVGEPWTRRSFLGAVCSVPLLASQNFPADRGRYADSATEFNVVRLTDPAYDSYLPPARNRAVSRKGAFLIYSSDRGGTLQVLRMDLKTGESTVLTDTADLKPWSVTLMPGERTVCYFAGANLVSLSLSNKKTRIIYQIPNGYESTGLAVAEDGNHAFVTEQKGQSARLRIVPLIRGAVATIAEGTGTFSDPLPRPRRAGVLYRRDENSLWLVNYDGQQNRQIKTAPGKLSRALWAADGWTALYLTVQGETATAVLRECTPDTNADAQVAVTSQYADFERNADGSVLLGVSGSKAQPYILLMLRSVKRELALCEHKASDPRAVMAQFSPDARRIFFQSDRSGKPAIYTVGVERLVESTESE